MGGVGRDDFPLEDAEPLGGTMQGVTLGHFGERTLVSVAGTLRGWETETSQREDGTIQSHQRALADGPVVETSERGALRLGRVYWEEVGRVLRGLVTSREDESGVELRVRGGPVLLRFASALPTVDGDGVRCRYPIAGGILARRSQGEIEFAQRPNGAETELRSTIRNFFPRLAARPHRPRWQGVLYGQVQRRLHLLVSRRYFERLIADSRR